MSSGGGPLHRCHQHSTPSTRSCTLYHGSITVGRAGLKLAAKSRRQLCKDSAKCRVVCSMELAGHVLSTRPKVLSPLLVCWRYIRYQSDLPLTSRGFSLAFGMSRKCPPELKSGVDRVLDVHTPTCDTCILTWGGLMSSVRPDPPSLRATLDAFNALMRAVPWVYHREGSRPEASSKDRTPATQEQRERLCSKQHRAGYSWPLDPL